jgi:SAM-dependent methyltransferase
MAEHGAPLHAIDERLRSRLRCPACARRLEHIDSAFSCPRCASKYERTASGALDLRLRGERSYPLTFRVGGAPDDGARLALGPLPPNPSPAVDWRGVPLPRHLTEEHRSYLPRARHAGDLALDLGCGAAINRESCEHAGFTYVGLDVQNPKAPFLGDAHALPFEDESFALVLAIATLEHLRFPFVAMAEVHRVLERGGVFLGTVAFLEPFHSQSYYHHSHLGTLNSLRSAGLRVEHVATTKGWDVLRAQAKVLFPGLSRASARRLVGSLRALDAIWCRIARRLRRTGDEQLLRTERATAGAFKFVAYKD